MALTPYMLLPGPIGPEAIHGFGIQYFFQVSYQATSRRIRYSRGTGSCWPPRTDPGSGIQAQRVGVTPWDMRKSMPSVELRRAVSMSSKPYCGANSTPATRFV